MITSAYSYLFRPAINIIATFVHNEPTSLTAIQEARVPETVYDAIETGIEPTFEASIDGFVAGLRTKPHP